MDARLNSLRVSMYDRAGMIHVNRITRDFAPTSNTPGQSFSSKRRTTENTSDHEFEIELEHALAALKEKSIDSYA
jgi:hypothetical protein